MPKESDFRLLETPIPALTNGQVLLKTFFLSVDPYMRGRISPVCLYAESVPIGKLMIGGTVGKVLQSTDPQFKVGDFVAGYWGWQEYTVSDGTSLQKLDPSLAPVSTALGVLGMPGMTAYFGFLDICQPKPGETVFISGAAGAVGSLVGQIAKIKGCRAVGSAGTDEKVSWIVDDLGFDSAFNYRTTTDYVAKLKELCPKGIDCYFDNVGGNLTDAVLSVLNDRARISVCGQISDYNADKPDLGVRPYMHLLAKHARAEGFLVYQFADRFPEGVAQMAQWIKEGKIKYREQFMEGFENVPRALIGVLQGENTGKMVVAIR